MTEAKDIVTFRDIQRSYPPGAEMVVNYQIEAGSEMKTTTRDWVGLFRVGWTSSRDYYTFEWAPQLSESDTRCGMVKFAGRRLPPEDGHFYQLCYVSRDGTVRGASAPFQFAPLSLSMEDMELVEVTDESMTSVMVLQKKSKEMESLRRESEEARTELTTIQRTLAQVQAENEALTQQGEELRKEMETSREAKEKEVEGLRGELEQVRGEMEGVRGKLEGTRGQLEEKSARVLDLERQVQTLRDSEQKLIEKLDHEKGLNRELASAKEGEEQQLEQYEKRVAAVEGEVVVLTSENEELKEQIRIKEAQVGDLQQLASARGEELEQLGAQLEASEQQNAEVNAACSELRVALDQSFAEVTSLQQQLSEQGSLHANVDALLVEKDEKIEKLEQELNKLEQELMVAQTNISELMGAQGTSVECPQQVPPLPPGNTVDRGAYDALQQAYDTMEAYYKEEQQQKEKMAKQLKIVQETSRAQYEDMAQRVHVCQKQYELKAHECVELQRRLKKGGLPTTVERVPQDGSPDLQEKVKEMERAQEQMVQDCQAAAQELSMRGEECRAQKERIEELEAELAQLQRKYDELEDHHDMKIAEKNDEFQRQKIVFDVKLTELAEALNAKGELEAQLAQLKGQMQGIRQSRGASDDRNCPVCDLKFPSRMHQQDFERHVQGHFNN